MCSVRALAAFLIIPASMFLYITLATGIGFYQRYPVVAFAGAAIGLFLLGRMLLGKFTWWRLSLNVTGWFLSLFFTWWTLSFSAYPESEHIRAGETPPGLMGVTALSADDGQVFDLAGTVGKAKAALFVFYRGYW